MRVEAASIEARHPMLVPIALLGVVAGALTTIAGLGGGTLLVVALSFLTDPKRALAAAAPALLVGNVHRVVLYRSHVDRRAAKLLAMGALPGSVAGGLLLARIPDRAIATSMVALAALAVVKSALRIRWVLPRAALLPATFAVGAAAATSGGAGVLVAPLLLATGLEGLSYVATAGVAAIAMHAGRIVAYGAAGLVTRETLGIALVLVGGLFVGNVAGGAARTRMGDRVASRFELASLVVCVALAVAEVSR